MPPCRTRLRYDQMRYLLESSVAETHLHIAYYAFIQGVVLKWNYVMQIIESVGLQFQLLVEVIHQCFIPALAGQV